MRFTSKMESECCIKLKFGLTRSGRERYVAMIMAFAAHFFLFSSGEHSDKR